MSAPADALLLYFLRSIAAQVRCGAGPEAAADSVYGPPGRADP